jgi:hypothetical protein
MKPDLFSTYNKASRVIKSCSSIDHIQPARQYLNLFFLTFSTVNPRKFSKAVVLRTDGVISAMFEELKKELKKVEEKFGV